MRAQKPAGFDTADLITLPPHAATMEDCCRLQEMLLGASVDTVALTTGVLEIISTVELAVTAVYTREDGAIDVRAIPPRRL